MRPICYDQRQLADTYCADKMREAEQARLANEARPPVKQRNWVLLRTVGSLGETLRHKAVALAHAGHWLVLKIKSEICFVVQGVSHRLRHQ